MNRVIGAVALACVAVLSACADTPAKAKKQKKAKPTAVAKVEKADSFPAARAFKTGLLYDAECKAVGEFDQAVLELPDWSYATYKGATVVDDLFSQLDSLDMVMVGSLAVDAFTGQAEQWRTFVERGGALVITDAGYENKYKWTSDLGPDYEYLAPEGMTGWPPTKLLKWEPEEPAIRRFPSEQVDGGILWYHWLQRQHGNRGGKAWKYIVRCKYHHQLVAIMARLGKGFIYITTMRCPYRVFFENMRASAELGLMGLEPVRISGGEMTNGVGTLSFSVKPIEGTAEPSKYMARLEITRLVEDGETITVDAAGKPGDGGSIAFELPYVNEIRGKARVRLLIAEKGAAESATLFDRPQDFPDFIEVKLPNYRKTVSAARRDAAVHLGIRLHPVKEDVRNGSLSVSVVRPNGQKMSVLSKQRMEGLDYPFDVELPQNAEPGDYRVEVKYKAVLTSQTYTNAASFKVLAVNDNNQIVVDQDNVLLRDGKPWFPLGLYHVPPESYAKMAEMGFDFCQQFNWWKWSMKDLKQYGICAVFEGGEDPKMCTDPGMGMWYASDEPQDPYIPAIKKRTEWVRRTDPDHPTFYVTLSEASFQYQYDKDFSDIIAYDCYPIGWDKEKQQPVGDHCAITNHLDKLVKIAAGRKPVMSVLGSWGHESEEQLRVMAYLAITHGANGLMWYCWDQQGGGTLHVGLKDSEKNQEIMKRLVAEIKELRPFLTSRFRQTMLLADGKVSAILCGDKETGVRLICVNPTAEPVEVTDKVEGIKTPFTVEAMNIKVLTPETAKKVKKSKVKKSAKKTGEK